MSDNGLIITTGGVAQDLFAGVVPVGGFEVCNVDLDYDLWLSDSRIASIGGAGCYRLPGGGYTYVTPYGYKPLGPVSVISAVTGHKITARKWLTVPISTDEPVMPVPGYCPVCPVTTVNPSSGATVTMVNTHRSLFVNNSSVLASLNIWMPPNVTPGEIVELCFKNSVITLGIKDAAGGSILNTPTNAYGPGAALFMRYVDSVGWVFWK